MLLKLLGRFLRPHWPLLVGVVVFQLAQSLLSLWLPTLNADIVDNGIAKGDTGYILSTGAEMLGVTIVQIACSITAVYFGAKVAMLVGRDLRGAIFHRVGEFSEREVTHFGAPSLITRNTNDVQQVQMLVLMTCTLLVSAPILAIGGIVLAMRQDIQLSWLIAVSVPVLLIAVSLIIVRMVPLFRMMQERIDRVNRVLREQLSGIRVVRAFVREDVETARFTVANDQVTDTAIRAGRLFALMFPIVMLVLNVSSVAVIWFGAYRVADGSMQIGTLTAFLQYLEPSVAVPANPVTEVSATGTVEFVGVGFSYPGAEQPVLSDVTFFAEAGKTTAIIGSTGAGKTTLINLIPRLFDATSGIVLVDGVDVAELDPELLWSRIGLVPQKPYLFSGTVATNLRYGNPNATDDELWRALEIAQAKGFVDEMPEKLDGPIAQGGTNVSGGQRQRLAIARALVSKPEIFIFDDSFSALDTATDARLRQALARSEAEATMIVVAQRVSTIVDADQIIVLDDGRVVGHGTHAELVENNPTYAEIVSSQLAAEEAA